MGIRPFEGSDVPQATALWNAASAAGETVFAPLTPPAFEQKLLAASPLYEPILLAAEDSGKLIGFAHGALKKVFLADETPENTPGYLTAVFVDQAFRRRGVGAALLNAMEARFRAAGKSCAAISSGNPVQLSWLIPRTPGHDHNNVPGLDLDCEGYGFFIRMGYAEHMREVAMYIDLCGFCPSPTMAETRTRLLSEGVETGRYDPRRGCGFNGMCDRVGSEYWRAALREEIAAHLENRPCSDPRFYADGRAPKGPRPILTAVSGNQIVGFTGPVDLQQSGRGWFSGICVDPNYGRRGIAGVLFDLLLQEFVAEGAAFASLFTGESNHAQRIYLNAGLRPVRRFCIMEKPLLDGGKYMQAHF